MLMAKVVKFDGLGFTALLTNINDETLQNFINKNPIDLENLQRNKKKKKKENLQDVKLAQSRYQNLSISC